MGIISCGTTLIDQGLYQGLSSVDWDTTPKTATFTGVAGNGYFCNTSSGTFTLNLPAGSVGDIIAVSDYASTFNTNAITISPNGTDKINGTNDDYFATTKGVSLVLLYIDSTRGWKVIGGGEIDATGASFITATGGTITCCGDYKIHTFTGPGTFTVTCAGNAAGSDSVEYLVVAGGGSGASDRGGGGGAGGLRQNFPSPATGGLPVSATGYPITVGGGASSGPQTGTGNSGSNSVFSSITSTGGGGGGTSDAAATSSGGSGGSGGGGSDPTGSGGSGNSPPVSPPQGSNGGSGSGSIPNSSGGGGGGGASGGGANATPSTGGNGGNGTQIPGVPTCYGSPAQYFGGGGGGGRDGRTGGSGGSGGLGGGSSGFSNNNPPSRTAAGGTNTGGGSGGGGLDPPGTGGAGAGGSGIVIIKYKFQ
jgi:hypothetical protein